VYHEPGLCLHGIDAKNPSPDRLMLDNHLEHINGINKQIRRVDDAIRKRASACFSA